MGGKPAAPGSHGPVSYVWLWPGLPELWRGEGWSGLATAVGFAAGCEILLLSELIWDEWLSPAAIWGLRTAFFGGWTAGVLANRRRLARRLRDERRNAVEDLFPAALAEYLQGNWFAAEQKCRDLLGRNRHDVDARLLLATLLRHVNRRTEARGELDVLDRTDGAAKWALEIAHERRLLKRAEEDDAEQENEAAAETNDEANELPAAAEIRRAA